MKKLYALLPLMLFLLLYSCTGNDTQEVPVVINKKPADIRPQLLEQGEAITTEMQTVLLGKLTGAIQDSGVAHALTFCNLQAYPLTDSISRLHGVQISRVSHKPRNPKNAANDTELALIAQYSENQAAGMPLEAVLEETPAGNGLFTYYKPIILGAPLCLKCHGVPGKDIAEVDYILMNMIYPQDQATGFKLGEVRGLWKVQFMKAAL